MSVTAVSLRSNGSDSGTAVPSARAAEAPRHSEVIVQAGCRHEHIKSASFLFIGMTNCGLSNAWAIQGSGAGAASPGPGRSIRPSAWRAKRPSPRGWTGSSLAQGQPPKRVRW